MTDQLVELARNRFGFDELRPGQREAVESVVAGHDPRVMPTGSGKSAIYQLAGLLLDGICWNACPPARSSSARRDPPHAGPRPGRARQAPPPGELTEPPRNRPYTRPMVERGTTVEWRSYRAVLLDLDGVITPTASVHQLAWAELFAPWGFTGADYLTHVDGKPRYDGVRSFLEARGVELPEGAPDDPPGDGTVAAMGNRKDELFRQHLERDGVDPYPGTRAVLDELDRLGIPQAVVSSSRNARPVLEAAGLGERFEHIVDGVTIVEEGIAGKPAPDMFLRAAALLGVEPADAVVVEDASSGVAAGAAGGFGLVLGVDRGGNRDALLANGADLVVDDLAETLAPEGAR